MLFCGIQYGFSDAPVKIKLGESSGFFVGKKKSNQENIYILLLTLKIALAQNYPSM